MKELDAPENNVVVAAKEYCAGGLKIIQWKGEASKGPREEGWNKPENAIDNPKHIKPGIHGIGLAHLYSRTCALDIDNLDLARKYFDKIGIDLIALLSSGVRISSGRPGRAKLIYVIPDDIKAKELLSINDQVNGFELRCATKNGMTVQDVLPPTIHPSTSKPYEWKGDWTKLPVLPTKLAQHWYERLNESRSMKLNDKYNDMLTPVIQDALMCIDPDIAYGDWLAIGMALSMAGLSELWDEWSCQGSKYQPDDCEGRSLGFQHRGENLATIGTIFHHATEAGWKSANMWSAQCDWVLDNITDYGEVVERIAHLYSTCHPNKGNAEQVLAKLKSKFKLTKAALTADLNAAIKGLAGKQDNGSDTLTHSEISELWLSNLDTAIVTDGSLWTYKDAAWLQYRDSDIRTAIASKFKTQQRCTRGSDYNQIYRHVLDTNVQLSWFKDKPVGLATPGGFYAVLDDGTIRLEQNSAEQRQRFITAVNPVAGEMPLFMSLLSGMANLEDQLPLLQEFIGAVIFNIAFRYQKVMLLFGETATGKSVLMKVLQKIVGPERCSAVPPNKFGEEYWRAQLATSMLNSVAELPDAVDISSPEFKQIMGADVCTGRHPAGRVFYFNSTAAYVFSSNNLPMTSEATDAFWRRWVVTHWIHQPSKALPTFEEAIYAEELPAILAWAIEGAQRLVANGRYTETVEGERMMATWKRMYNPLEHALSCDDTPFILGDDKWISWPDFSRAMNDWCLMNDRKFPGRNKMIEMGRKKFPTQRHGNQGGNGFRGIGLVVMGY